jgi:hypothetical protein
MAREYHVSLGAVEIETGGSGCGTNGEDGIISQTGHLKRHYYMTRGARFYLGHV